MQDMATTILKKIPFESGVNKIQPHRKDYSLLHTFGATLPEPKGFPDKFSIYDGREIPNQTSYDNRFRPSVRPLPYGCTGETQSFDASIQDKKLFHPDDLYDNTPPFTDGTGRDLRLSLQTTKERGFLESDGTFGYRRKQYFNVYGAGAIDDFDAARIALWINQDEKRGVSVGSWWYQEFMNPNGFGLLSLPSFRMEEASLHNYLVTGWKTINDQLCLEMIPWLGMNYGNNGLCYASRPLYNALLAQPYTAAFTNTKKDTGQPITIGIQAYIDHLVYMIRSLFRV